MRRLSLPQSLRLTQLHRLDRKDELNGGESWEMVGSDSQFRLQGRWDTLRPGAYRFSIKLGAFPLLKGPKLYLDSGEGHSEAATVPMVLSEDRRGFVSIFQVASPVTGPRFAPDQEPGKLCIESVQLRRISTTGLRLTHLAQTLHQQVRSPRDRAGFCALAWHLPMTAASETTRGGFAEAVFAASAVRGGSPARAEPISTADYPRPGRRPANLRFDNCRFLTTFVHALRNGVDKCVAEFVPPSSTMVR